MAEKPMFLFVGTYRSVADAKADDDIVHQLYRDKVIGTYDAAVISKDAEGKVHINRTEKPTQHGAEIGAGIGAAATLVAGLFFPPVVLVNVAANALGGAGVGALVGHLRKGMSHRDLRELGDALQESEAALIVVGESRLEEALKKAAMKATKMVEKQVRLDAEAFNKDLEDAMRQATARL